MLVYKDTISGDELFSDSYPIKLVDDLVYEVEGKVVSQSNDIDEKLIGGNKATEPGEEDEGVDSSVVTGINVVLTHKLVETSFDKTSFKGWLKDYMKVIVKKIEDKDAAKVEPFKKAIQKWAGEVLKKFDEWKFYIGENMNPEGMVVLQGYRDDQTTPYFVYIKDGLDMEKY